MPSMTVSFNRELTRPRGFFDAGIEFFRSNRKPSFVHDCSQIASLESGKALAGGQASVAKNHEIRYARFGDGALMRGQPQKPRRTGSNHLIQEIRWKVENRARGLEFNEQIARGRDGRVASQRNEWIIEQQVARERASENMQIGGGAPDDPCRGGLQLRPAPLRYTNGMYEDDAVIQSDAASKPERLAARTRIDAFCKMNDEWPIRGCLLKALDPVRVVERVGPAKVGMNLDREIDICKKRMRLVVVAHGGDTREHVADDSPPEPLLLWDLQQAAERRLFGMVDIDGPLTPTRIRALSEPRENAEMQMIVSVNEPWKQKVTAEIDDLRLACKGNGRAFAGKN